MCVCVSGLRLLPISFNSGPIQKSKNVSSHRMQIFASCILHIPLTDRCDNLSVHINVGTLHLATEWRTHQFSFQSWTTSHRCTSGKRGGKSHRNTQLGQSNVNAHENSILHLPLRWQFSNYVSIWDGALFADFHCPLASHIKLCSKFIHSEFITGESCPCVNRQPDFIQSSMSCIHDSATGKCMQTSALWVPSDEHTSDITRAKGYEYSILWVSEFRDSRIFN